MIDNGLDDLELIAYKRSLWDEWKTMTVKFKSLLPTGSGRFKIDITKEDPVTIHELIHNYKFRQVVKSSGSDGTYELYTRSVIEEGSDKRHRTVGIDTLTIFDNMTMERPAYAVTCSNPAIQAIIDRMYEESMDYMKEHMADFYADKFLYFTMKYA